MNIKIKDFNCVNFTGLDPKTLEYIRKIRNNENIRKCMYSEHIISKFEHLNFVDILGNDKKNLYYAVFFTEKIIGIIYLNKIDLINRTAYLGLYSDINNNISNKGKILLECLEYIAFKILKLRLLLLEVLANNKKALIFYKKNNYAVKGVLEKIIKKNNKFIDVIIMQKNFRKK